MNIGIQTTEETYTVNLMQVQAIGFFENHVNFCLLGDMGLTIEKEAIEKDFESFKDSLKAVIRTMDAKNVFLPNWIFTRGTQLTSEEDLNGNVVADYFINPAFVDLVIKKDNRRVICFIGGGSITISDQIEISNINPVLDNLFPVSVNI